jgi:hypothetical protein
MDCISCTDSGVVNRVLVNRLTGEEVGLYCEGCEAETFGRVLGDQEWHQDNGCAFCDGSGTYLLPRVDCLIEADDGSPRLVEYLTIEGSVSLCPDHVDRLLPEGVHVDDLGADERDVLHPIEA